jgi:LuxR family maltose regulon positive regulatory protein
MGQSGAGSLRAAANCINAWLALWQADLARADVLIAEVEEDSRWLGQPPSLTVSIQAFKLIYHALRGEVDRVHELGRAGLAHVDADPERRPGWRGGPLYNHGRACAALEDWHMLRAVMHDLAMWPTS